MLEFIIALLNKFVSDSFVFMFWMIIGTLLAYMAKLRSEMKEDKELLDYADKFNRKGK